jgi:hypothetical protein
MLIQLLLSSQLFLLPLSYSYITKQWILLFSFTISYLGSTQYYINYKDGENVHHLIDVITARTGAIIDFFYTFYYIKPYYLSFLLLHNVTVTYLLSRICYQYKHPLWVIIHLYFHICTTFTWVLITFEGNNQLLIN